MDVSPTLVALASWAAFACVYGAGAALCVRGIDPRRVVVVESAVTVAGCAALSAFLPVRLVRFRLRHRHQR